MEDWYLSGSAHYLTAKEAQDRADNTKDASWIKEEADGTFSIFYLSPKPIQHGQSKFQLPAKLPA